MIFSKYNIFSRLRDSNDYFIVNLLSGNADIISPEKAEEIKSENYTEIEEYIEKGYLVNEAEEARQYKLKYLEFIENRENDEVQIFFVPRYACNFNCSYCYQGEYENENMQLKDEVVDAFFSYIDSEFVGRKKYITIFGGEPLLGGKQAEKDLEKLVVGANIRDIDIAVVTNGYHLNEYMDILKTATVREIQVTLDGTKEIHDKRRVLKSGEGTFDRIVTGIDSALSSGLNINLRVVVDRENADNLKDIARFAIEKGWTKNPLFKTQLGRNYELHTCQAEGDRLFSRVSLYEKVYEIVSEYPEFLEFHRPAYSVSRFLFENGELSDPLFDSCPGTKTEWAFDYTGALYSCTATVGKKGEELGTFYPRVAKNFEAIEEWEERDVVSIPECKECNLQLACGGGCASSAKNRNGSVLSPDCRPINELMEMGISLYFNSNNNEES